MWCEEEIEVYFSHTDIQFNQQHLLRMLSFSHWLCRAYFVVHQVSIVLLNFWIIQTHPLFYILSYDQYHSDFISISLSCHIFVIQKTNLTLFFIKNALKFFIRVTNYFESEIIWCLITALKYITKIIGG